jgi:hypothetical protein
MSSSRRNILAANGFGRGSLTVAKAWALYEARYPVPPDMHLPGGGAWKMAVNGIGIPPAPMPGTELWFQEIRDQRRRLQPEELSDPTWAATDNNAWWVDFFQAR